MALQEELEMQGQFLFKHRSILPIIILIVGWAIYVFQTTGSMAEETYIDPIAFERFCLAVSLLGLMFRIFVIGHAHQNTSGRNTKEQLADNVNTKGIYSVMRHPLYTGNFIMWLGIALMTQNLWFIVAFVAVYTAYYERIMFAEEQFLRRKFGQKYLDWAANTPAFLPKFSNWQKPELEFSIRKVLRQEKNGLWAIFIIMFLFQQTADYLNTGEFAVRDWLVTGGLIVTTLYYLVIKTLQKTTKLLQGTR